MRYIVYLLLIVCSTQAFAQKAPKFDWKRIEDGISFIEGGDLTTKESDELLKEVGEFLLDNMGELLIYVQIEELWNPRDDSSLAANRAYTIKKRIFRTDIFLRYRIFVNYAAYNDDYFKRGNKVKFVFTYDKPQDYEIAVAGSSTGVEAPKFEVNIFNGWQRGTEEAYFRDMVIVAADQMCECMDSVWNIDRETKYYLSRALEIEHIEDNPVRLKRYRNIFLTEEEVGRIDEAWKALPKKKVKEHYKECRKKADWFMSPFAKHLNPQWMQRHIVTQGMMQAYGKMNECRLGKVFMHLVESEEK